MLADLIFTTPAMELLFSDETELRLMLAFESALATAQGAVGAIPGAAAEVITCICAGPDWDVESVRQQTLLAGNPAIPFVDALRANVRRENADLVPYVHLGATSQDVIDTVLMMQLRQVITQSQTDLNQLTNQLTQLAQTHRDTPMMGRTLLQQALPITVGDKVTGWLSGLLRMAEQLQRVANDCLLIQLGGPVGNGNSLGVHGHEIRARMAVELRLGNPPHAWHTQRDRLADIASTFGILNGLLGKLGNDIILLMQTEVDEVREGAAEGKGGSSSMPHKRNPVTSTFMVAIAHRTPGLVASMLTAMIQPHERAAGAWHSEWPVLRELARLTAANLHHANALIRTLEVDTKQMQHNIDPTR